MIAGRTGLVPVRAALAWTPVGSYLTDRFGFCAFSGPGVQCLDRAMHPGGVLP